MIIINVENSCVAEYCVCVSREIETEISKEQHLFETEI